MQKNEILITGSCNPVQRLKLFENVFETRYQEKTVLSNDNFKFFQLCDLNRLIFDYNDFTRKCNDLRNNKKLKAIIMLSNLNPRPETLMDDTRILLKAFDGEFLKEHLYVIFTFSNKSIELNRLRKDVMIFDQFFNDICCRDREKFIKERIWILDETAENINRLKKLPFLIDHKSSTLKNTLEQENNIDYDSILPDPIYKNLKKIILIGPMGYGKSSTGNKLLNGDYFTTGTDLSRVTTEIRSRQSNEKLIIDCPGFGDTTDYSIFYNEINKYKIKLIQMSPINAFVLVIKFDCDKSAGFLKAAQEFVSCFGKRAIKSLIVLCIQGNDKRRYDFNRFQEIYYESDGHKYLERSNGNKPVPYCLWDNFNPYFDQDDSFENLLNEVQPFPKILFQYSFELIDKENKYQNKIKNENNNELDTIKYCDDCRLCRIHHNI